LASVSNNKSMALTTIGEEKCNFFIQFINNSPLIHIKNTYQDDSLSLELTQPELFDFVDTLTSISLGKKNTLKIEAKILDDTIILEIFNDNRGDPYREGVGISASITNQNRYWGGFIDISETKKLIKWLPNKQYGNHQDGFIQKVDTSDDTRLIAKKIAKEIYKNLDDLEMEAGIVGMSVQDERVTEETWIEKVADIINSHPYKE